MKRLAVSALILLILLPTPICTAAEDFYCEYTPKSERSSVFYVDVYSGRDTAAAIFELSFSDSMVSFHSVTAGSTTASVRENVLEGKVRIAFADTSAVTGKICRVSFKALQTGEANFTLHMVQAADGDQRLLTGWEDDTLSVTLGQSDVVALEGSSRSSSASSASSRSQRSGVKSYSDHGEDEEADDDTSATANVFDLRKNSALRWMLIGAGIVILIAALVLIGVLLGRRINPQPQKETPPPEATEKDTIDTD